MKHYCLGFVFDPDQDRVLLLSKRSSDPYNPETWNGLGGKVESGETALEAMVRECQEEAGLRVDADCWEPVGAMTDEHTYRVDVFAASALLDAARQTTDELIMTFDREAVRDLECAAGVHDALGSWLSGGHLL